MRPNNGFTLVELMIVVMILGVLATIALPRFSGGAFTARCNVCRVNVDLMNSKIELFHVYTGSRPTVLKDVIADPDYFPDGPPQCPFNTPYILETIKDRYRVPKHLHAKVEEVEAIPKEEDEEEEEDDD